mmetsp:Transcript_10460/g.18710  ORF Transcript_10460/g.18710 Transcript_10460/m.18710 type:complete len:262 (+) Transcript_10460:1409-2194(+)
MKTGTAIEEQDNIPLQGNGRMEHEHFAVVGRVSRLAIVVQTLHQPRRIPKGMILVALRKERPHQFGRRVDDSTIFVGSFVSQLAIHVVPFHSIRFFQNDHGISVVRTVVSQTGDGHGHSVTVPFVANKEHDGLFFPFAIVVLVAFYCGGAIIIRRIGMNLLDKASVFAHASSGIVQFLVIRPGLLFGRPRRLVGNFFQDSGEDSFQLCLLHFSLFRLLLWLWSEMRDGRSGCGLVIHDVSSGDFLRKIGSMTVIRVHLRQT